MRAMTARLDPTCVSGPTDASGIVVFVVVDRCCCCCCCGAGQRRACTGEYVTDARWKWRAPHVRRLWLTTAPSPPPDLAAVAAALRRMDEQSAARALICPARNAATAASVSFAAAPKRKTFVLGTFLSWRGARWKWDSAATVHQLD